jgi:hypothetical protein
MWTAFFVLNRAVDWPASLQDPASIALPRFLDNKNSVLFGYSCYLLSAALLVPVSAAFVSSLGLGGTTLASLLQSLAALSALAKLCGICRWLFAVPVLAGAYSAPTADRDTVALLYELINAFAGGIGEALGIGLFSGLWTVLAGWALIRAIPKPGRGLGIATLLSGLGLLVTIPAVFGWDLGPLLTISNMFWQFCLLGIGAWLLLGRVNQRPRLQVQQ